MKRIKKTCYWPVNEQKKWPEFQRIVSSITFVLALWWIALSPAGAETLKGIGNQIILSCTDADVGKLYIANVVTKSNKSLNSEVKVSKGNN